MTTIIYGQHSVKAALAQGRVPQTLYTHSAKVNAVREYLKELKQSIPINVVEQNRLDEMTERGNHQGWVAVYSAAPAIHHEDKLTELLETVKAPFFLILDEVQDPHNLGACLRSADAAGVTAVIIPKDNAVGITPVVQKVASGAAESVTIIQVTNLARSLQQLKQAGVWLYGLETPATASLYDIQLTGAIGLVLGAEGKGLRRLTREACDQLVFLPMQGQVTSLNVSVAAGVCLYEVLRQRQAKR